MLVKMLAEADPPELRFAELLRCAPGISHKMLAQTLKNLVRDGLVTRRVEPTVPPHVHYALTALGRTLDEPLAGLRDWAQRHMATIDAHRASNLLEPIHTGEGDSLASPNLGSRGPSHGT